MIGDQDRRCESQLACRSDRKSLVEHGTRGTRNMERWNKRIVEGQDLKSEAIDIGTPGSVKRKTQRKEDIKGRKRRAGGPCVLLRTFPSSLDPSSLFPSSLFSTLLSLFFPCLPLLYLAFAGYFPSFLPSGLYRAGSM